MSMNDRIADTFARIKNAQRAKHAYAVMPSSKEIKSIIDVLEREGYITGSEELSDTNKAKYVKVDLKYHEGMPVINHIGRISKGGCRVYKGVGAIPRVQGGLGIAILHTSKGVLSDHEAKEHNVGGELIGECW